MKHAAEPDAKTRVETAYGYATFSNFGVKIFLAGSGSGRGVAINNQTQAKTFMNMAEIQLTRHYAPSNKVKEIRNAYTLRGDARLLYYTTTVKSNFNFFENLLHLDDLHQILPHCLMGFARSASYISGHSRRASCKTEEPSV